MYGLSVHATIADRREPTLPWNLTLVHVDTFVFPKDKANKTASSFILREGGKKNNQQAKNHWKNMVIPFFNVESHGKLLSPKCF